MEKLVEAVLLVDNLIRRGDDDLPWPVEEAWLGVVDRLIDMGVDIDEETAKVVAERENIAQKSTNFVMSCVNYRLKNRCLWQRIFGPHEIDSKMVSSIREHIEELLGVY